jgi:hypothetical protein
MDSIIRNFDIISTIFTLISFSLALRLLLEFLGQRWITTTAHTVTILFLPIITFVITKVISGNIALSLGMVGALSIVRFRNPVRSPLELTVYFGVIAMGITATANILFLYLLAGSVLVGIVAICLISFVARKFTTWSFFNASFAEGNSLSTLEIATFKNIEYLDRSKFLQVKSSDGRIISYVLASNKFHDLQNLLTEFEKDKRVKSYQLSN